MDAGRYPENWSEISKQVKDEAGWKCEICGHPHDPENGYCLTTMHLIPDTNLNERWNLAAACQRCHLRFDKVEGGFLKMLRQMYLFEPPEWLIPHLKGYADQLRQDAKRI